MILAVDIGNSLVKIALLGEGGKPVRTLSLETDKGKTADEYASAIELSSLGSELRKEKAHAAILSSVVSSLTPTFLSLLARFSLSKPLLLGKSLKSGIALRVDHPAEVGSDLIAAAAGAVQLGRLPAFVADFGTASKFIYVGKDGSFLGVAIAPGLRTGAALLKEKTASLPEASLALPPSPLGKNTFDSLNAGILYGQAYMCRGFLEGYERIAGEELAPYLTGGNAVFLKALLGDFVYEKNLVMEGLFRIYSLNEEDR